ncbi:NADH dehydrogenase, subunit 1, putative [Archaeoglobus fulgidus DSM 4304]|uniref:Uncharacterized protein AF_2352 n=1 Tax=Archaeoglobus fulgidus (strain ATCC 49558 / DSM 4304 / JCM 9628 / NBRC 100126 / VC-16) TaxID=224325 RepID=Y2352_ARCFU|nr:RecName: Full=Uncharacterized protein AF_2352 [Archaeoglobus fulgidus DSM 4304]AAB91312.1 NADH dehydrogenase, subunit 1, putative [Archaeoglobus fulgidus DSM 4304]MDI3497825.1 hypothetical protein [Archaeoglobus sp.]
MTSTFFKYSVLLLPALINLAAFLTNFQTNTLPVEPINLYLSNFVHSDFYHLTGNIVVYIVSAFLSFIFFRNSDMKGFSGYLLPSYSFLYHI